MRNSRAATKANRSATTGDSRLASPVDPRGLSTSRQATRAGRGISKKTPATRQSILLAAARVFAARGYEAATIRDIASEVDLLPGSLYHHFASKDALIEELYRAGIDHIIQAVQEAVVGLDDPWERLEAVCRAHIETIVDGSLLASVLSKDLPATPPELVEKLVTERDRYDKVFAAFVADLGDFRPLEARMLRLQILGSLNWATRWFHVGGRLKAANVAHAFVKNLSGVGASGKAGVKKPTRFKVPGSSQ